MSDYLDDFDPKGFRFEQAGPRAGQDIRDGSIYVYQEPIKLAVRVALATGRPLLLLGPPGSGKSSLAAFTARTMNWNYFEQVVTSRTKAQDLLWSFDAVRRLRDAHADQLHPALEPYIEPRVLWWAFDPGLAGMRGSKNGLPPDVPAAKEPGLLRGKNHPSVVLIDEIDKADPDVPNDLLVSLGSQKFRVDDIGSEVSVQNRVLVFITSNNERSLPVAFLRRCVIHNLQQPDEDRLVKIAENHFAAEAKRNGALFRAVAKRVVTMREPSGDPGQPPPSTAEYLDAIRACLKFGVQPGDTDLWNAISSSVLVKRTQDVVPS